MDGHDGRWGVLRTAFAAAIASLVLVANGFAAALVQDVKGDVRTEAAAVSKGQRILTGATLTTGPGSQAILEFDDGQQVVLNENTRFGITDYRFQRDNPQSDRSIFSLLSGAARVVTGTLAQRSRSAFEFRTPTSTIGIRGTDFMAAVLNQPSYLSVLQGEIAAVNAAGTVTFGAGTFGVISAANVLAAAITAAALPAAVASAFSSLGAVAVGAGASAAAGSAGSAGGAVGGAVGGIGVGAVAAVGAVGAVAVAASSGGGGGGGDAAVSTSAGANPFAGAVHGTYKSIWSGTSAGVAISGNCDGTWSGTIDSAGNYSGTLVISTCTSGSGTTKVAGTYPDSGTIDSAGNVVGTPFTQTTSGITASCTAGTGKVTATTVNVTNTCTVSGTPTGCTGSCSVSLTGTETYTGTRP